MTGGLVVIDPDGHPGVHRATCGSPRRRDLASPVRPTTEAEIRERGWDGARCRRCQP